MTQTTDPLLAAVAGGVRLIELGQPFFTGMPCSPNHPGFRMTLIRRHCDMERPDGGSAANEIIVMTRPHVVAELFHLDWTSRARRHLGVPILHLLEHEPLDIEAGYGQGITGA